MKVWSQSADLTDDERKIVLLGLKLLFHDIRYSRLMGYPVEPVAILNLVEKLGGIPNLISS